MYQYFHQLACLNAILMIVKTQLQRQKTTYLGFNSLSVGVFTNVIRPNNKLNVSRWRLEKGGRHIGMHIELLDRIRFGLRPNVCQNLGVVLMG